MNNEILINEGGINVTWFTRIKMEPDDTVTILEFYSKHNTEEFSTEEKNAIVHPEYHHQSKWKEEEGRIAVQYNVPGLGWKVIKNPKYIFSYTKEKPTSAEEAKQIIEQVAEEKKSMMEIVEIVDDAADEKLKKTNPECYATRDKIYEGDLFDKLRNKIEEKKKSTNYPNARTKEENELHVNIQTIELALYDTYKIPLYKIGLAENLKEGFEWLVDEILISYAKWDRYVREGEDAVKKLFPAEESYYFSDTAKEFSDFLRCEKEDYKIYAIEFIKKMCGK